MIHYTGMASADEALARLCDPAAEVSAHYLITETGTPVRLVPEDLRAWHRDHVGEGNGPLAGWKSALSSPALFSRYVTDRLAGTVIPPKD